MLASPNAAHILVKSQLLCLNLLPASSRDLDRIYAVSDVRAQVLGALLLEVYLNCGPAVFVTPGNFVRNADS